MKTIKIETEFDVYQDVNELPKDISELMAEAVKARLRAYAPYSNFLVGAALLLENGEVITGNNQENAAYPSGLCAERTAIFYAGSRYPDAKIISMAIVAGSTKSTSTMPIPPCGSCRQAISEYEIKQDSPINIYFMGETGEVMRSKSLSNLLPFHFEKTVL